MSYQEKYTTVSLTSYILILGYFVANMLQMIQGAGLDQARVITLWVTVITATILVNIIANILTNIVFSIVHAIRTRSNSVERFIADERDKLIDLKGNKVSYITFSIGVFVSMLSFVFGQPPLVMFSLIIFFSIVGEVAGCFSQLVMYRRGL